MKMQNSLGFSQVIFDSLSQGKYFFRFADLSGGQIHSGIVSKDPTVNFIFYSFNDGGVVRQLEPPKDLYDLLFTQYTTLLFTDNGEAYPYLVTGVLINRNNTEVAIDSAQSFSNVTLQYALNLRYSHKLDAIGYTWKYYSFITGAYSVRSDVTYIIHTRQGYYFKLRFVGFYNKKGEKGYPVIEYQRI